MKLSLKILPLIIAALLILPSKALIETTNGTLPNADPFFTYYNYVVVAVPSLLSFSFSFSFFHLCTFNFISFISFFFLPLDVFYACLL